MGCVECVKCEGWKYEGWDVCVCVKCEGWKCEGWDV